MVEQNVIEEFIDAVKQEQKEENNTYSAVVNRIDDEGTVWVRVAGSDSETPIATTSAEIKRGDEVNVEWRNNQLYIAGNTSDPSAGVVRVANVEQDALRARVAAKAAVESANTANEAAQQAVTDAATAHQAADDAQDSADAAQTSADNAASAAATAGRAASVAQAAAEAAQGDIDEQKEWFWHDTNGSHVLGAESGYRNDISSTGMKIVETATEETVAEFGVERAVIGTESTGKIDLSPDGIVGLGEDGVVYFQIISSGVQGAISKSYSEIRNISTISQSIDVSSLDDAVSGSLIIFEIIYGAQSSERMSAPFRKGSSSIVSGENFYVNYNGAHRFTISAVRQSYSDATIRIRYSVIGDVPTYTMGIRNPNTQVGANSFVCGNNNTASASNTHAEGASCTASGANAHAEGNLSVAQGIDAHAEGYNAYATENYSHAEGDSTTASGVASHAEGRGTTAAYLCQHASGKYNDNQSGHAFEIGNGTVTAASNAFTVDWDGNVELALDTTAAAGTTDGDLYAAITALGWESEVIA